MRIKVMDGIPCIVIDEGIFWSKDVLKQESNKLIMPEYFTECQQAKENTYYKKVLGELKRKFVDKKQ